MTTTNEKLSKSDAKKRRLDQEELIRSVTDAVSELLEERQISRAELARRMGRSRGYVSQLLGGGRNLTLRTLSDIASALDCSPRFELRPQREARPEK